jgi:hypothetical protein
MNDPDLAPPATMRRQFLACKFRPSDTRTYTYHWDGEPIEAGAEVKVPDRSGDGWRRVTVHEISWDAPPYPTKAILGRAPAKDQPEAAPLDQPATDRT